MNAQDKKKFIDVCMEITKYGQKVNCAPNEIDDILSGVDENYLRGFARFLGDKSCSPELEDEAAWDNWYENLTYEDIDERDIDRYGLPAPKIQKAYGNDETFVKNVLNYAREYYDNCATFVKPQEHNLYVEYQFGESGIFIQFISRGDRTLAKGKAYERQIRTKIDNEFSAMVAKVDNECKKFNDAQGRKGLQIKTRTYRNGDVEPDCHTARCLYITAEEMFYIDGEAVPVDYVYKFFRIVKEEAKLK